MVMQVRGGLDAQGRVVAWDYEVWTPTHSTRPRSEAGNPLAGQLTGRSIKAGLCGGDRNSKYGYVFPNGRVVLHWLPRLPPRHSALRGLGPPQISFSNYTF